MKVIMEQTVNFMFKNCVFSSMQTHTLFIYTSCIKMFRKLYIIIFKYLCMVLFKDLFNAIFLKTVSLFSILDAIYSLNIPLVAKINTLQHSVRHKL